MTEYENFKANFDEYSLAKISHNDSGSADKRVSGRQYAVNVANRVSPGVQLTPYSPAEDIDRVLVAAYRASKETLKGHLDANLESIINEVPDSGLIAKFASIFPSEIRGDDEHNSKVGSHKILLNYERLSEALEKGDPRAAQQLARMSAGPYAEDKGNEVEAKLRQNKFLSDETINFFKGAIQGIYFREGIPERDLPVAIESTHRKLKKEFESQFAGVADKEKYARLNLRQLVTSLKDEGEEGLENAGKLLYSVSN